ncbi:MAG: tetratricopeptide repeat protein, partial [Chitinophagaceae bacterium]
MSSRINNINLYIKSVIFLCIFFLGLSATVDSFGQKINTDSIQKARKEFAEASRIARQKSVDSAREVRLRYADSLKSARKKVTDSLATIRKYKESKKYKDSLSRARAAKIDSARIVRAQFFDSVKAVRQQAIDSMNLARKRNTDSIRSIQKARADSLASIRNYRESKRYKDSVAFVRQSKLDSTRAARKAENEILVAERKRVLDSAASVRQAFNDSLKAERTKVADSIKLVRKARADSLTKMKENREKLTKSREKLSLEKKELAFQLKIKKKREVFSNEKMLKKKWSVPRKIIQNTYTRYNYYFNADRKMDEALDNMQRMRKENYDSLLALFPFDPDRDSTALAPDMDSIIQKASVGIQIHDPRTKWADDLYLLLGQAYYYKGNYDQATTAFKYIISLNQQRKAKELKEMAAKKKKSVKKDYSIVEPDEDKFLDFLKHESANNEAILWLARTFTESHKEKDAESILDLISTDKNMPEELHGRLALERAYLNISQGRSDLATGQLSVVAAEKSLPEWLRLRASYLNGQLLYNQGKYNEAATQFQEAIDLHPKIEMDFYARRNLAYSLMEQGGNQETATASLRHMLNDGKYLPYHEQVYYVLGRLSANSGDYKDAVTYLKKSVEGAKTTRRQKAISFASLGNVYY